MNHGFNVGDVLILVSYKLCKHMNAPLGSHAIVVPHEGLEWFAGEPMVSIRWLHNIPISGGQNNGGYYAADFELLTAAESAVMPDTRDYLNALAEFKSQ